MASKNRRMFELRLGKLGLILFIGGMSLLLFSMFLMGVIVGKSMEAYPDQYSQGIPEMIHNRLFSSAPKAGKTVKPVMEGREKNVPAGGVENFGLTFYDTLGGKKGETASAGDAGRVKAGSPEISSSQAGTLAAVPGGSAARAISPTSEGEDGLKKKAPRIEGPVGETGAPNSSALPAPGDPPPKATAPSRRGYFEIQVAAYREKKKAEQLVQKFEVLGFSPRVVMKEIPEKGRWFRVIVGGFESQERAREAVDKMTEKVRGLKCVIRPSGNNVDGG